MAALQKVAKKTKPFTFITKTKLKKVMAEEEKNTIHGTKTS